MRGRGTENGPILRADIESASRLVARNAARNRTIRTLAISPGWNEKPAIWIQSLEP